MEQKKVYLTRTGLEKFKKELDHLISEERSKIAKRIGEAKEYGDLSENSEYTEAKDHQAFVEGKIVELEHVLKNAIIIDENHKSHDNVRVGCKVQVNLEDGNETFFIVGSHEADPDSGKISNESPIGKALLGRKVGDEIEVEVPAGKIKYKIIKID